MWSEGKYISSFTEMNTAVLLVVCVLLGLKFWEQKLSTNTNDKEKWR